MTEIILPPEENEETPQTPELNIDKPTENSKVITIEFEAKKTNKVSTKDTNQQLYTTDTDAWFEFKETSLEGANGTYSVVFRNRHDGSIFQRTGDVVNGVAYYKIPHQEIRHAGAWRGQVVYTLSNGDTTAREFDYDVQGHILDGKDVREIVVEDFETLMSQLRSMKDNAEVELANLTQELRNTTDTAEQNETDRQAFFDDLVEDIDELQSNYQELLDTGVLQTNINTKLEALEEEYAPKLTEVTAQLAQKANQNATFANAQDKLMIVNYLDNIQNIHPKVLYFENGWNEWKFWMGYTPYPGGNPLHENPSIAVSMDGINWRTPDGLTNPLAPGDAVNYNNDTHLLIKDNTLEIWWRRYNSVAQTSVFLRRTSSDGVEWSPEEVMFNSVDYGKDLVSPSIMYDEGVYKLWGINVRGIRYNESVDGKTWDVKNERTVYNPDGVLAWHMDIIKSEKGYEIVLQGQRPGETTNTSSLFYLQSLDNSYYEDPILILEPTKSPGGFDNQGIYRASVVMVGDLYYVYYSAVSTNNRRAISLAVGDEITNLQGYVNNGTAGHAYKFLENSGVHLPDVTLLPTGISDHGAILRASPDLQYTAQLTGMRRPDMSGGLQIGTIYFDNANEIGSAALPAKNGAVRRGNSGLELHDGEVWTRFTDIRGTKTLTAPQTIEELDISDTKLFIIRGSGEVVIETITGGNWYDETRFILDSTSATATFKQRAALVNPNLEDFTLDRPTPSCNVMRMTGGRYRLYI